MNLNEGEKICEMCGGEGEVIGDYPYGQTCSECNGKGKVDWVTKAMGSVKNLFDSRYSSFHHTIAQPNADITFSVNNGTEVLKVCENGDFFVRGNKVTTDKEVYDGFVDFLKGSGYYK